MAKSKPKKKPATPAKRVASKPAPKKPVAKSAAKAKPAKKVAPANQTVDVLRDGRLAARYNVASARVDYVDGSFEQF